METISGALADLKSQQQMVVTYTHLYLWTYIHVHVSGSDREHVYGIKIALLHFRTFAVAIQESSTNLGNGCAFLG